MNRAYPTWLKHILELNSSGALTSVYKVMLLRPGASYSLGQATIASLIPWQIVATGYAASADIAPLTVTIEGGSVKVSAGEAVWATLGGATNDTIGAAVVYNEAAVLADSIPALWIDEAQGVPGLPRLTDGSELRLGPISMVSIQV